MELGAGLNENHESILKLFLYKIQGILILNNFIAYTALFPYIGSKRNNFY